MAIHWLVFPASGGDSTSGKSQSINHQWQLTPFSGDEGDTVTLPALTAEAAGGWQSTLISPPEMLECYASFAWTTTGVENNLTQGGALTVATVFPTAIIGSLTGSGITPFAKVRVSNINRLSRVQITVCDSAGNIVLASPRNWLSGGGALTSSTWGVISDNLALEVDELTELNNLRIQVSFSGVQSSLPGSQEIGQVICDIEWLAVKIEV